MADEEAHLVFETTHGVGPVLSFDEMGIKENLLSGIYNYGFDKPCAIHQHALLPIISGVDVIAQAESGIEKTSMIAIAVCQNVDTKISEVQVLILSPSREMAVHTEKVIHVIGKSINIQAYAFTGGKTVGVDIKRLQHGVLHVVSGMPGRVCDMIKRGTLRTKAIKTLILDDTDEMFTEGFKDHIYDVYKYLPSELQVVLISNTFPKDIREITYKFMNDPVRILVKSDEPTFEGIKQYFIKDISEELKFHRLCHMYDSLIITKAVIFCHALSKAKSLTAMMKEKKLTFSCLLGDMPQKERDAVMKEFRSGQSRVLVTTDVFAKDLDIQEVCLVISYDLPRDREHVIHRINQTGRFGCKGLAIHFVKKDELEKLRGMEKYYNTHIDELPMNIDDLILDFTHETPVP